MDLISEVLLGAFAVEEIGPAVWGFFTNLCEFLGDEGSSLMLEIVPNLKFEGINIIYNSVEVDAEGIIVGWTRTFNLAGVDTAKMLRFLQIVSGNMAKAGIQWVSTEGKQFFLALMSKLNEYSGPINIAMATSQAISLLQQWKASHTFADQTKDVADKDVLPVG